MILGALENKLLEEAQQAFLNETGMALNVIQEIVEIDGTRIDAVIQLPYHRSKQLAVVVKRWAQQANLGALANQIKRLPMEGVLVADYINPKMGKKLKEMDVQYFDAVGNAYINQPPVYIHVTGNKQRDTQAVTQKGTNRAFDTSGLKVIFGFLCDPQLVAAPYREIAERTNVALGTVGWVLNGLKDAGFIIDRGKGKQGRRLVNRRKILDRWVEAYPEKLKPKQLIGEFVADEPLWWKKIEIEQYGAYWGGELAAAEYTNYLKPETLTVYLPEKGRKKFFAKARLQKIMRRHEAQWATSNRNIVEIYRPFWSHDFTQNQINKRMTDKVNKLAGLVHPILVYADLVATGDSRNLETAGILYEQFIAEHIGEG